MARQNAIVVATLVRTTLVALHHANVTGNYSVLRDLAAPSFRDRNSAADLAVIFAPIRGERIDLGAVVVLEPTLTAAPLIDNNQMLRIEGTFPTRPAAIRFQLLFQAADNVWRLFGLSVNPIKPVAEAPTGQPAPDPGLTGRAAILPGSLVPPAPRQRPPAPPQ